MTTFDLKRLSCKALPTALAKAERYRLLNEPWEAESICRDVLAVEPDHQQALVLLILALTDQFDQRLAENVERAREVLALLHSEYERAYYTGIISERRAKAHLLRAGLGSKTLAYYALREAMDAFEKAEATQPADNDDALLRWNTCARVLIRHPDLEPGPEEQVEPYLE